MLTTFLANALFLAWCCFVVWSLFFLKNTVQLDNQTFWRCRSFLGKCYTAIWEIVFGYLLYMQMWNAVWILVILVALVAPLLRRYLWKNDKWKFNLGGYLATLFNSAVTRFGIYWLIYLFN